MNNYALRQAFPIFSHPSLRRNNLPWVYLDSAATSQKPEQVIEAITQLYQQSNANVHRASHEVAREATQRYEAARDKVAAFINAPARESIVWTKGATESVNVIANGLTPAMLNGGKQIVISATEHHANIVPWQQFAQRHGMGIDVIPVDDQGVWDVKRGLELITSDTAIVAIGHVSNALGNINPVKDIIEAAKGVSAVTVTDGAQAMAHMKVDVQHLDCDFYLFSGHKMFAPTGIGVLYGKRHLLEALTPFQYGGEMIKQVTFESSTFQPPPQKFEAGTPNIEGVIGLGAAIDFINQHRSDIADTEQSLYSCLVKQMRQIPNVRLWGDIEHSVATLSFTVDGMDNQDVGILLNEQNIAVRVGHHCTMPLMSTLGLSGTLRVSLGCYNTEEEVAYFVEALKRAIDKLSGKPDSDKVQIKNRTATENAADKNETATQNAAETLPLAEKLRQAKGWDEKYRQIMLAGKSLPRLDEHDKTPENSVHGCESQVWISVSEQTGRLRIQADSPSKIIRGLLAVIIEPLSAISCDEVANFDVTEYLQTLGLEKHISQSRGNGLRAVVEHIKGVAER